MDDSPDLEDVVADHVDFYAHTVLMFGITENIWRKVGKSRNVGQLNILFRGTNDFDKSKKISESWFVWEVSGPVRTVGKLIREFKCAESGSVVPAEQIVSRIKTGEYAFWHPGY